MGIALIDVWNKARDVIYVYESESYWDRDKKQPRSHRKLIGRRDPETGEIVPTRKYARKGTAGHSDTTEDREADRATVELLRRVASLEFENERLRGKLDEVRRIVG